jgi:hypothetical protein
MRKSKQTDPTHRNVVLKIETYRRLQSFLVELVKAREMPRITFDEAINELLDRTES